LGRRGPVSRFVVPRRIVGPFVLAFRFIGQPRRIEVERRLRIAVERLFVGSLLSGQQCPGLVIARAVFVTRALVDRIVLQVILGHRFVAVVAVLLGLVAVVVSSPVLDSTGVIGTGIGRFVERRIAFDVLVNGKVALDGVRRAHGQQHDRAKHSRRFVRGEHPCDVGARLPAGATSNGRRREVGFGKSEHRTRDVGPAELGA
jgi:hypothetical protein